MRDLQTLLARHENIVLQFSGGKDSLACLYLLRPFWERISVLWINTGDAFPETLEQMRGIEALVPRFVEVRSTQPANLERYGPPADVLSAWDTPMGHMIDGDRPYRVQTPFACCAANIWTPLDQASRVLGATLVIRGQRNQETKKSPIRNGHVENGIEYCFPIETWTDGDVRGYLVEQGVELPAHYAFVNTSLDCQSCTAYLSENIGKFAYMRQRHPDLYAAVGKRLTYIRDAALAELRNVEACRG